MTERTRRGAIITLYVQDRQRRGKILSVDTQADGAWVRWVDYPDLPDEWVTGYWLP